jgi:hypothetical protein
VPEQDGEFARDGDGRDLVAAAGTAALMERAHWPGRADREQCRLGEGVANGAGCALADSPAPCFLAARLADGGIQSEVADQMAG